MIGKGKKKKVNVKKASGREKAYVVWFDASVSGSMKEFIAVGMGVAKKISAAEMVWVKVFWADSMSSSGTMPDIWFEFFGAPEWSTCEGVFPSACIDSNAPDTLRKNMKLKMSSWKKLNENLLVREVKEIDKKDIDKEIATLKVLNAV